MKFNTSDFSPFPTDGLRIAANLASIYDAWIEAVRERESQPSSMYWVSRGDSKYLGIKVKSRDSGTTIGARDAGTEAKFADYLTRVAKLDQRIATAANALAPTIRQYRSLKLPMLAIKPGQILRELDIAGLMGSHLMLVGTNAFAAYQLECGRHFPAGVQETEDIDFAWWATEKSDLMLARGGSPLLQTLRSFDPTFQINKKKPFQATNDAGYEVELLVAPSRLKGLSEDEVFSPVPGLIEQEWLLRGQPIRHVVTTQDNKPCLLYVPDPRWMALHKLWLGEQEKRNTLKRPKDILQGNVLLDATRYFLQVTHPLNIEFTLDLPQELRDLFLEWSESREFTPSDAVPNFR